MELILLERVEKLGQMGDVVKVKPGFARNFLLPQGKALRATEANRKRFETERAQLEAQNLERKQEADSVAEKMADMSVVIIRAASESGQLYGSVNGRDIAEAVSDAGVSVTRTQVVIDRPIKTLGIFDQTIRLHPEVSVAISINVAQSAEEAEAQADRVARGEPALLTAALADQQEAAEIAAEHAAAMAAVAAEVEAEEEAAAAEEAGADGEAEEGDKPAE
ncbi:MAG: 50S ribosomal protein L9 [Alphaproteobacteria bacterium]|nr:50S ribosomal protein L9 [Alphaproteobacteria bacterium]